MKEIIRNACTQVISAVDITIEEANKRCEQAVRHNLVNVQRRDDTVMEQVMFCYIEVTLMLNW